MDNKNHGYQKLSQEEFDMRWQKHREIIQNFLSQNGFDTESVSVNRTLILTIISKVDQRYDYFRYFHDIDISELKEIALNAFWIIKLKPLSITKHDIQDDNTKEENIDDNKYDLINEKLAIYYILRGVRSYIKLKKDADAERLLDSLPKEYFDELLYTFTFRDISKEAMILLVESMVTFMGINPYRER